MGLPTLIIGKSGTGKTTSLRNLDPEKCLLIQAIRKPLPFRSNEWKMWDKDKKSGSVVVTDKAKNMIRAIENASKNGKEIIIIDDFQYQMSNTFMRKSLERGYDKFTEIAKDAWEVVHAAIDADEGLRIYILSHTQEDDLGENVRMKTIGKLLDDKITMEGMFTIVLRTCVDEGEYLFSTQNDGKDTVKSPMGLFSENYIPNDLKSVDDKICDYYGLTDPRVILKEIEDLLDQIENEEYVKTVEQYVNQNKDDSLKLRGALKKLKEKSNE